MSDTLIAVVVIFGIGILSVAASVALLLIRDWFTSPSKQKLEEYSRRFIERLRHPDFVAVEEHFGHPLPSCIQSLYVDEEELLRGDFDVAAESDAASENRWYVAYYQPADAETVRESWPGLEKYFAFANDGCGNEYLIEPGDDDLPVLFHDHETGELSRVCDHFSEFMQWPRLEAE